MTYSRLFIDEPGMFSTIKSLADQIKSAIGMLLIAGSAIGSYFGRRQNRIWVKKCLDTGTSGETWISVALPRRR